jgi:hypothetical protein
MAKVIWLTLTLVKIVSKKHRDLGNIAGGHQEKVMPINMAYKDVCIWCYGGICSFLGRILSETLRGTCPSALKMGNYT